MFKLILWLLRKLNLWPAVIERSTNVYTKDLCRSEPFVFADTKVINSAELWILFAVRILYIKSRRQREGLLI